MEQLNRSTFAKILPFLKSSGEAAPIVRETQETTPLEDFIPFHSHYNPHTLLTKNGELLQIIKISANNSGLNYEVGEGDGGTVRETIRNALAQSLKAEHFSVWIHTLRKRKGITYHAEFEEPFAMYLYEAWQRKHPWKYSYYNEIYITVLHDGQSAEMLDKKNLHLLMSPKRNRSYRGTYLDASYVDLDATVSRMLENIRGHYNARRLSLVEKMPQKSRDPRAIFYSEPMEFLSTITTMRTREYPLTEADISTVIRPHSLTFGFNALETKNTSGRRRFAGILSLKQYREMPPEIADRVLQAPVELVVSQSFSFVPYQHVLKEFREQKELFEMSGDEYSMRASGLEDMLAANHKQSTDYGEHQTTIMIIADDFKSLDMEIGKLQGAFGELGLITIREDIKLEEAYWAQLPGNFEFIRRRETINTERSAGLARLNRFPSGTVSGNHWGQAIALIPTMVNSPYAFNFHYQDNGHTLLYDFNSFNDLSGRVLLNFLLTHTRQYNGRMFVFDRDQSSRLLMDKLSGNYHFFAGVDEHHPVGLSLNPLQLEDSPRNRGFLTAWTVSLLSGIDVSAAQKTTIQDAIGQLYAQPAEERNLPSLIAIATALDPELSDAFAPWHGKGQYSRLFGMTEDLDLQDLLHGFGMDPIVARPELVIPVFSYLLHRIITNLDGKPTIIVLHSAWDLLENPFFAPRLESLLEMLKENNALVIFTTSTPDRHTDTHTYMTLKKACATHIFVPDEIALNYEALELGLSTFEAQILHRMERQKGQFLLKQGHETIALNAWLQHMDDCHSIFANDIKNLIAAGGPYATLSRTE